MGKLTREEIRQIRKYLEQSGLSYAQLQDELLDHLICDIEVYMEQGLTFRQAWKKVNTDIPENQFKNIQTETMEILNKKTGAVKIMAYLSFFLLLAATIFKLLHLMGTGLLMLSAFGSVAITMLLGSFKGVRASKNKIEKYLILSLGVLITTFIISIFFQVLNWPGVTQVRNVSVFGLMILMPAISVYLFFSKNTAHTFPHLILADKNKKIIETVLIGLVSAGIVVKIPVLLNPTNDVFVPIILLTLALFIAGLYIFILTWRPYVSTLPARQANGLPLLLVSSIVVFFLFMVTGVNWQLSEAARIILPFSCVMLFSAMMFVYYLSYSQDNHRYWLAAISFLFIILSGINFCYHMQVFDEAVLEVIKSSIFNFGVLTGLIFLFIIFYKKPTFRVFMLFMLAHYMYTYPVV